MTAAPAPQFSYGASGSLAAPSSTVGQLNTPDMRHGGFDMFTTRRVNVALADNAMSICGEYREHGRSVSQACGAVPQGRLSLHETPVFIISREPVLPGSSVLILEDAQPHTLPGGGQKPHRAFLSKANHDLSLSHGGQNVADRFSKVKIMSLEARTREKFAKRLARFVEKERDRVGCAKTAMKTVAKKLGMSMVGVYRAMNGYGPVKIQAHHYTALLMHSLGIVKAAASRMKTRRHAASIHA